GGRGATADGHIFGTCDTPGQRLLGEGSAPGVSARPSPAERAGQRVQKPAGLEYRGRVWACGTTLSGSPKLRPVKQGRRRGSDDQAANRARQIRRLARKPAAPEAAASRASD